MPIKTIGGKPSVARKTYEDAFKTKVVLAALRETMPHKRILRVGERI